MAEEPPAETVRRLMRSATRAALGTLLREAEDAPYVSLVGLAADHDGAPILLLSELALHTRNLRADERASLLIEEKAEASDPLAGARVSLQGRVRQSTERRHRERYLERHPAARDYADFRDFAFYHLALERAHLVAGFGRIHWLDAADVLIAAQPDLLEQEPAILAHMNDEHRDALQLYAHHLLHQDGDGWRLIGIDPEGCDLRLGPRVARLPFDRPVTDAAGARAQLVELVKRARAHTEAAPS